ncbi:hypothetical protein CL656_03230 [bacterium]|nr:hypothetical protein [bacterium]|tara:strand:- start:7319 stop:7921 length:603 start_codon:yes stop_codon:yes gene_type:complete
MIKNIKSHTWIIVILIIILSIQIYSVFIEDKINPQEQYVNTEDSQDYMSDEMPFDEVTEVKDPKKTDSQIVEIKQERVVEYYIPSQLFNQTLELSLSELQISLQRGDAELAPTYLEFFEKVQNARNTLNEAIDVYEAESVSKKVSSKFQKDIESFRMISNKITMSLKRGDAELAPTYSEFYSNVSDILQEFRKVLKEYKR